MLPDDTPKGLSSPVFAGLGELAASVSLDDPTPARKAPTELWADPRLFIDELNAPARAVPQSCAD